MNDSQKSEIGKKWAEILMMKKSKDHPDRYLTTWGDKTPLGIYMVITRLTKEDN